MIDIGSRASGALSDCSSRTAPRSAGVAAAPAVRRRVGDHAVAHRPAEPEQPCLERASGVQHPALVGRVRGALVGQQEPRARDDRRRPGVERQADVLAVRDPAGEQHGRSAGHGKDARERVEGTLNPDEVTSGLDPLNDDAGRPFAQRPARLVGGADGLEHERPVRGELLQQTPIEAGMKDDSVDPGLAARLDVGPSTERDEQVRRDRSPVRSFPRAHELGLEPRRRQNPHRPQASGGGHGPSKLRGGYPSAHPGLDDRMLETQLLE